MEFKKYCKIGDDVKKGEEVMPLPGLNGASSKVYVKINLSSELC